MDISSSARASTFLPSPRLPPITNTKWLTPPVFSSARCLASSSDDRRFPPIVSAITRSPGRIFARSASPSFVFSCSSSASDVPEAGSGRSAISASSYFPYRLRRLRYSSAICRYGFSFIFPTQRMTELTAVPPAAGCRVRSASRPCSHCVPVHR